MSSVFLSNRTVILSGLCCRISKRFRSEHPIRRRTIKPPTINLVFIASLLGSFGKKHISRFLATCGRHHGLGWSAENVLCSLKFERAGPSAFCYGKFARAGPATFCPPKFGRAGHRGNFWDVVGTMQRNLRTKALEVRVCPPREVATMNS